MEQMSGFMSKILKRVDSPFLRLITQVDYLMLSFLVWHTSKILN